MNADTILTIILSAVGLCFIVYYLILIAKSIFEEKKIIKNGTCDCGQRFTHWSEFEDGIKLYCSCGYSTFIRWFKIKRY
jgi:isoprenylcysteine carboxyl methyltransferase (ICMT) family protein YpbQ